MRWVSLWCQIDQYFNKKNDAAKWSDHFQLINEDLQIKFVSYIIYQPKQITCRIMHLNLKNDKQFDVQYYINFLYD